MGQRGSEVKDNFSMKAENTTTTAQVLLLQLSRAPQLTWATGAQLAKIASFSMCRVHIFYADIIFYWNQVRLVIMHTSITFQAGMCRIQRFCALYGSPRSFTRRIHDDAKY